MVIWFTGLSGSGKSTLAKKLFEALQKKNKNVEYLDGDAIRNFFPQTGFTKDERTNHVKRVGYMASRLEAHGVTVVASLISPYRESRDFIRGLCKRFMEIYVSTPIEVCESRDVKGLYAKARRGELKNFTGVSDPYEAPLKPELVINTAAMSEEDALNTVLQKIAALEKC